MSGSTIWLWRILPHFVSKEFCESAMVSSALFRHSSCGSEYNNNNSNNNNIIIIIINNNNNLKNINDFWKRKRNKQKPHVSFVQLSLSANDQIFILIKLVHLYSNLTWNRIFSLQHCLYTC